MGTIRWAEAEGLSGLPNHFPGRSKRPGTWGAGRLSLTLPRATMGPRIGDPYNSGPLWVAHGSGPHKELPRWGTPSPRCGPRGVVSPLRPPLRPVQQEAGTAAWCAHPTAGHRSSPPGKAGRPLRAAPWGLGPRLPDPPDIPGAQRGSHSAHSNGIPRGRRTDPGGLGEPVGPLPAFCGTGAHQGMSAPIPEGIVRQIRGTLGGSLGHCPKKGRIREHRSGGLRVWVHSCPHQSVGLVVFFGGLKKVDVPRVTRYLKHRTYPAGLVRRHDLRTATREGPELGLSSWRYLHAHSPGPRRIHLLYWRVYPSKGP